MNKGKDKTKMKTMMIEKKKEEEKNSAIEEMKGGNIKVEIKVREGS